MSSTPCYFDYRLQVSFAETNVVGNVYFANYFIWQGKCREAFLAQYAPRVLEDFADGHGMITKESSCEFFAESFAFNHVLVRMQLEKLSRTAVTMGFDYYRESTDDGISDQRSVYEQPPDQSGTTTLTLLAKGRQMAIWVNPQQKISMLPGYLYDAIVRFNSEVESK